MNWQKCKPLLINTLQKEYRNKTLLSLFILTIVIIVIINIAITAIVDLSEGQVLAFLDINRTKVFYTVINLWSGLLAALIGVNCVQSDYDYKVIMQLLSLPIKRSEYLGMRLLGSWLIVVGYYVLSLFVGIVLFGISAGNFQFDPAIIGAFMVASFAMLAIILLGVFFALFLNRLISFVAVLIFSSIISQANNYATNFSDLTPLKALGLVIHYLLPRVGSINQISSNIFDGKALELNPWIESVHFILSTTVLFLFIHWLFRKKEAY